MTRLSNILTEEATQAIIINNVDEKLIKKAILNLKGKNSIQKYITSCQDAFTSLYERLLVEEEEKLAKSFTNHNKLPLNELARQSLLGTINYEINKLPKPQRKEVYKAWAKAIPEISKYNSK